MNHFAVLCAPILILVSTPAAAVNLLQNGDFEASSSPTITPPGWTNIGHTEGVLRYSDFGVPAYDGNYFYDLGGFGNAFGPVGDGIMQTVGTTIGQMYVLTFGLSSEDVRGISQLDVFIGELLTSYTLTSSGTFLGKGFSTQTINYTATASSTDIKFIQAFNNSGGNNDPVIDRVIFESTGQSIVPEPASWTMLIAGFGLVGAAARRQQKFGSV